MSSFRGIGERSSKALATTVLAVVVSTLLAIVKITAGIVGHSYALIADGIESILDILSGAVVWAGLRVAALPPDDNHPFGHGKAESMAAMVVAVCLLAAALGIATRSVGEILAPQRSPAPFTLAVLVLVVLVKELLFRRLSAVSRAVGSTSLAADAWHHRSDALTSAAAFAGISVALIGGPGFESADGWAALFACGVIGFNGVRLLRVAVAEIMDAAAPAAIVTRIRDAARAVPDVRAIDKCLVRKSGPGWLVGIHVWVDGTLSVAEGHAIAHRVKDALLDSEVGVLDALVHIEPEPDGGPGGAGTRTESGPARGSS